MFLLRHTANDKDFLVDDGVVPARPARPVGQRADGVLDVARRRPPRRAEPARVRVRPRARRRVDDRGAPPRRLHVPRGRDPLARRPLPGVRRAVGGHGAHQRRRRRRPAPARRRASPTATRSSPSIKGSAINNDGQRKVGYLAPSVDGHADVVKEALAVAGLSARDIQLLEAHGTGTARRRPDRGRRADRGVPRLDRRHRVLPARVDEAEHRPPRHRRRRRQPDQGRPGAAPPHAAAARQPHRAEPAARPRAHAVRHLGRGRRRGPATRPRRAGVSSLGVGGTNAHVIVEEAPPPPPTPPRRARAAARAVGRSTRRRSTRPPAGSPTHLEADPDINLADVAHTLATGRRAMPHRRVVAATDTADAIAVLRARRPQPRRHRRSRPTTPPRVAFMFPGGGSQYTGMGAGLDDRFDVFHEVMRDGIARVRRASRARPRAAAAPRRRRRRAAQDDGVAARGLPHVGRARPPVDGLGRRRRARSSATASASTPPPTSPACSRSTTRSTWSSPGPR